MAMTVNALARHLGGHATGGDPETTLRRVCVDSRTVAPGDLFVAVRGHDADGHRWLDGAVAAGCSAVAVMEEVRGVMADKAVEQGVELELGLDPETGPFEGDATAVRTLLGSDGGRAATSRPPRHTAARTPRSAAHPEPRAPGADARSHLNAVVQRNGGERTSCRVRSASRGLAMRSAHLVERAAPHQR